MAPSAPPPPERLAVVAAAHSGDHSPVEHVPTSSPSSGLRSFFRKPRLAHVAALVFLDALAMTLGSTLVQDTQVGFFNHGNKVRPAHEKQCLGKESSTPACRAALKKVQDIAGYVSIASAILAFFMTPLLGALSDAYGRRRVLLMTLTFSCIQYGLLVAHSWFGVSLWFYIVSTAGTASFQPLSYAFAFASDITEPRGRAAAFALLMASLEVSIVLGPILANYTSAKDSVVFAVAASCVAACWIYSLLLLPESLSMELQLETRRGIVAGNRVPNAAREERQVQGSGVGYSLNDGDGSGVVVSSAGALDHSESSLLSDSHSVSDMMGHEECEPSVGEVLSGLVLRNQFKPLLILNRTRFLRTLAAVAALLFMAIMGTLNVLYMYLKGRFGMDRSEHAIMAIVNGACGLFVQSIVTRLLARCCTNYTLMLLGLFFQFAAAVLYAVMWEMNPYLFFILPIGSLGSLTFPALTALKSNAVGLAEQGAVQGALSGVRSLGSGLGPLILNRVLSATQDTKFPQAPFFITSGITLSAFLLTLTIPKKDRDSTPGAQHHSLDDAMRAAEVAEEALDAECGAPITSSGAHTRHGSISASPTAYHTMAEEEEVAAGPGLTLA